MIIYTLDESERQNWEVLIRCALAPGYTQESAEIDDGTLGEHIIDMSAHCVYDAMEQALDYFHRTYCIGDLEGVVLTVSATRRQG